MDIRDLRTYFDTPDGTVHSVDGVSYRVEAGETLGVVGESGCGKSVTVMSVLRLLPTPPARYAGGEIRFRGTNLLDLCEREMSRIRGNRISMIFHEPMTSLTLVLTVGCQIADRERRAGEYPYQMSGGMRQRVMIALALACHPDLLIADEPTTALDVTIQAQILELLCDLQAKLGMGIVMITHDLGVVAEFCDRVVVMYAGRKVEEAPVADLFERPLHPYTRVLMASMPSLQGPSLQRRGGRLAEIPGMVPAPQELGTGCAFAPRCPPSTERCPASPPPLPITASPASRPRRPLPARRPASPRRSPHMIPHPNPDFAAKQSASPLLNVSDLTNQFHVGGKAGQGRRGEGCGWGVLYPEPR